jgi:preprotein translocase subunit SecG
MTAVILVIHLILAVAMIGVILLQQSEGGGLGIGGGGGGGGMGGFMTARGTANLLTRATAIIATAFMATSITLAILANQGRQTKSIIDEQGATPPANQQQVPAIPQLPQLPNPPQN